MITEPDLILDAGDELVGRVLFVLIAALLGAALGLGFGAWLVSQWAVMLIG